MSLVNISIDQVALRAEAQSTILEAARQAGLRIPSLCDHPDHAVRAVCRVCMVEVDGKPVPACATRVSEGLRVSTKGREIERIRKTSLELILSNHPMECQHCARNGVSQVSDLSDEMCSYCRFCDCLKDGDCELQQLARELNVTFGDFDWIERREPLDRSTASLVKDPNKCILCRRCVSSCGEMQGVHAWSIIQRGEKTHIAPPFGDSLAESPCVECGQCVKDCPTGALYPRPQADELYTVTDDRSRTVIACIDPNFIAEFSQLGEYADLDITEGHLVAGLHRVGIDLVWPGADLARQSIRELMAELEGYQGGLRFKSVPGRQSPTEPLFGGAWPHSGQGEGPLIGYSSYAAKTFAQSPEWGNAPPQDVAAGVAPPGTGLIATPPYLWAAGNLSAGFSGQQLFGRLAKGEWAPQNGRDPGQVFAIALTASLSGKAEAAGSDAQGVDLALTPLEVRRLFRRRGADLSLLAPEPYDRGGAAGPRARRPGERGITQATSPGGKKIALAQGLDQARRLLEEARAGASPFDLIYISALPGEGLELSAEC